MADDRQPPTPASLRVVVKDSLTPQQREELGLSEDWWKETSDEELQHYIDVAVKYKDVLRTLSKM